MRKPDCFAVVEVTKLGYRKILGMVRGDDAKERALVVAEMYENQGCTIEVVTWSGDIRGSDA